MNLLRYLFFIAIIFMSNFSQAEVGEISEPLWEKVPNIPKVSEEQAVYINVNGINKKESIVEFDFIAPDAFYERIQMNCDSKKFRRVKSGFFESETRVNYENENESDPTWIDADDAYKTAIYNFSCTL